MSGPYSSQESSEKSVLCLCEFSWASTALVIKPEESFISVSSSVKAKVCVVLSYVKSSVS